MVFSLLNLECYFSVGYNLAPGGFINLIAKAADVEPTILGYFDFLFVFPS